MDEFIGLGLDIGGANLKGVAVKVKEGGDFEVLFDSVRNFTPDVSGFLDEMRREVGGVDAVGVTSTAEYGLIVFRTIAEGISTFRKSLAKTKAPRVSWITLDGRLIKNDSILNPYDVAAANWVASALFVGEYIAEDCILVDAGSTTTDIIPVVARRPTSKGRLDWQRLGTGELVYTGAIGTGVSAIVHELNVRGSKSFVSSENFSTSADIHLILNHLTDLRFRAYTLNSIKPCECYTRLAHMVCADDELLNRETICEMASQVYDKQVADIGESISQVWAANKGLFKGKPQVVAAGLGSSFLAKKAAEAAGFYDIVSVDEVYGEMVSVSLPAASLAVLAALEKLREI
jgi:(4-(4-[2-(gamma-L-glutamylamino)ethyl]phenoxymethyl)furan-2-yl)methanamine synthase